MCNGLCRTFRLDAFARSHTFVCLLDTLPSAVAVHRIESADDSGDSADACLFGLCFDPGDVARSAVRGRVPAVREGVNKNILYAVSFCRLKQTIKMLEQRVYADVTAKAHNVHLAVVVFHEFD